LRHGEKIQERQLLQERMANVAIDIYLATATLARASNTATRGTADADTIADELDCARLFINTAFRRARRTMHGLRNNQDELLTRVATRSLSTRELGPQPPLVP
jgi:hypothetical protein